MIINDGTSYLNQYVCVCVCVSCACVHVRVIVYMSVCLFVYLYVYMSVCMYICMYVYLYVCMYICMYVCGGVDEWVSGCAGPDVRERFFLSVLIFSLDFIDSL